MLKNDEQVFKSQQKRLNNERIKELFKLPPPSFDFDKMAAVTEKEVSLSFETSSIGGSTTESISTTNFGNFSFFQKFEDF